MPFVKLDIGILDSSLWLERTQREVFITALLMAEPHELKEPAPEIRVRSLEYTGFVVPAGWYGFIHAAGVGILHRAGISKEEGMQALEALVAEDYESKDPDYGGRRLVRVDGGYIVLNFMKYRDQDYSAKERMQRLRERKKAAKYTNVTPVTRNKRNDVTQQIAEAEAESEAERTKTKALVKRNDKTIPFDQHADPVNDNASGKADREVVAEVFDYYLGKLGKNKVTYSLTPLRMDKGLARYRECLKLADGDRELAAGLMHEAVDGLLLNPWNMGRAPNSERKFVDWENHVFRSMEVMQQRWSDLSAVRRQA